MTIDFAHCRRYLKEFDFDKLFREELGWDHHSHKLEMAADGQSLKLAAIAQKRGFAVYLCSPDANGRIPDYPTRRKVERQVGQVAYEHLIIFTDAERSTQVWQWVRREQGKPDACREHTFHKDQSGDALLQKLQAIAFDFAEEEELTVAHVAARVQQGFYADRVTKKFYDRFKKEHEAFLKFIKGLKPLADAEWYASLMLNRLMFVYFIQKKGFLDGDHNYLRNRMRTLQERNGKGKFLSFYRHFLLRLFHEGLGQHTRNPELDELLGRVPYLNGGLFDVHRLESENSQIEIPDQAFEKIFDFFDAYRWHLDERPLRADNEINPDVLGYIFEKYINQKQMGAYYTKEDITEYIGKNTIIPFLFDAAEKKCAIAFKPDSAVWRMLSENPDRYIYQAVRKGVDVPLPPEIEAGASDVSKREGWNRPAAAECALPTETWREHVARRQRCHELRAKLKAGEIHSINDLITYNLDIRQFAQDVIADCEGPELLRAFYYTLAGRVPKRSNEKYEAGLSILDPTCGSGAFLFAALNILEPLYKTCLTRMDGFVTDLDRSDEQLRPEKFSDFRHVLADAATHSNRSYFILKTIILNNLFGVDIMEEAVEICKLRLFLKLVAQVERVEEIEPLPDIDFNIRAGNTLVGFASYDEAQKAVTGKLQFDDAMARIGESAEIADRAFKRFREMQAAREMDAKQFAEAKQELRRRLKELDDELDRYLAGEYNVKPDKPKDFEKWRASHQPFHWFVEFYGIIKSGGFDVIIGNPPYAELRSVSNYAIRNLKTIATKNLYPLTLERCLAFSITGGRLGFIVPVSSISTEGYKSLQEIVFKHSGHFSSFDDRPARLFDGLEHIQLTIHLIQNRGVQQKSIYVTGCYRWSTVERDHLFAKIEYQPFQSFYLPYCLPKLSRVVEQLILNKLWKDTKSLGEQQTQVGENSAFYSRKVHNFLQALDFVPEVYDGRGKLRPPSELKELRFAKSDQASLAFCAMNSTLFRWFINVFSDCRHVNKREVEGFRLDLEKALKEDGVCWNHLGSRLSKNLQKTSEYRQMKFKHDNLRVQCIIPKHSKPIIDEIDRVLAKHYGFTDEELDFIINYDIKYRMGRGAGEEEE